MTGERARRFPLGLDDLVREPRRPDGRPGDAHAVNRASSDARPKPAARGVDAAPARQPHEPARPAASPMSAAPSASSPMKPRAPAPVAGTPVAAAAVKLSAATPSAAGLPAARAAAAQPLAAKSPDAKVAAAKPLVAKLPAAKPPAVKPPVARRGAAVGNRPASRATHASLVPLSTAAALPKAPAVRTARSSGAPDVALNSALALTSERVRERMVERLRANGILDQRVIHAMSVVPRHMFVDPGLATQAYEDAALPIGHHQTISKPSVVARMIELAAAGRALGSVLEIGTGCGYQAAVLSQVARDVYSIERIKPLYERAKTNLRPLRIPNIRLHYGDGRVGLPSAAPFDAIVIAAAGLDVPQALLEQLAPGGRLVAPVGAQDGQSQVLTLVERTGPAQWRESRLDRVFFVPLKSGVI
jgi:protein-L-isoaspartate(D-aspartate) O-methyltransferase